MNLSARQRVSGLIPRPSTARRRLATTAAAVVLAAGGLAVSAAPAAAVFPAGENGDAVYVLRGEVWRGHFADSGRWLETRLTRSGGTADAPRWDPEGTRIAYTTGEGRLRTMAGDGSDKRTVLVSGATDPAWSPPVHAQRRLAFVRAVAGGRSDVWSVRLDGSGLQRMTFDGANNCGVANPDWSAKGKWLTYLRTNRGVDAVCGTADDQQVVVLKNLDNGRVKVLPQPEDAPDGPQSRPQVNSAGTMVSWLAGSECRDALAVYNLISRSTSVAGWFDYCGGNPHTLEYPPTPASAETVHVYTTAAGPSEDSQGCLRIGNRTYCEGAQNGVRAQVDLQPLH